MTSNETSTTTMNSVDWFTRLRVLLINPPASIQDVGKKRRAQLLSVLTLILTIGLAVGWITAPYATSDFLPLILITVIAYAFSRTTLYQMGIYFFCFGFAAYAFTTLFIGTASSYTTAITTSVYASLIIASILLSLRSLIVLVVFVAVAAFSAPLYSQIPIAIDAAFYRDTGNAIAIGAILVGANAFRAYIEHERLKELNRANHELETLTASLEQRVNERTAEFEVVNQQTLRRAAQLKAVTELSESIAQLQDLNEIFPAATALISERFGFYHVGIFLVYQDRQYAILQAANSEGG